MDWIQLRTNLDSDPRVQRIVVELEQPMLLVIGALWKLWSIADEHSVDGRLVGMTAKVLDHTVQIKGFTEQLIAIEWLEEIDGELRIARFEDHNGTSAKQRVLDARRKAAARRSSADERQESAERPEGVRKVSVKSRTRPGHTADKNRTEADKSRTVLDQEQEQIQEQELKNPPPPPLHTAPDAEPGDHPDRAARVAEWRSIQEAAAAAGLEHLAVLKDAFNAGITMPELRAIIVWFQENAGPQGMTPKALHYRLKNAVPGQAADKGWPNAPTAPARTREPPRKPLGEERSICPHCGTEGKNPRRTETTLQCKSCMQVFQRDQQPTPATA